MHLLSISDLLRDTERLIAEVKELALLQEECLQLSPALGRWSILQIIDHLNVVFKEYDPIVLRAIEREKNISDSNGQIELSFFGKMFIYYVSPESRKKLPAPKLFQPRVDVALDRNSVIDTFLSNEYKLQEEMIQAKTVYLNGRKFASPISRLIRFRLGELFTVIIRHQQRHFLSIKELKKELNEALVVD